MGREVLSEPWPSAPEAVGKPVEYVSRDGERLDAGVEWASSSWSLTPSGSTSTPLVNSGTQLGPSSQPTIAITTNASPLFPRWFQIGQIRQGTKVVAHHRHVGALAVAHNRDVGQA